MVEIYRDKIPKWLENSKAIDTLFQDEDSILIEKRFYKEDDSFTDLKELKNLISTADYWELEIEGELFDRIILFLQDDEYNYYSILTFLSYSDKETGFYKLKERIKNEIEGYEFNIDCELNIYNKPIYRNKEDNNLDENGKLLSYFYVGIILIIEHKQSKLTYKYDKELNNSSDFEYEVSGFLKISKMLDNVKDLKEKFKKFDKYKKSQSSLFKNGQIEIGQKNTNIENYYKELFSEFGNINYNRETKTFSIFLLSPYNDEENKINGDELVLKFISDKNILSFEITDDIDDYLPIDSNFEIHIDNINKVSKEFLKVYEKLNDEFNDEVERRKTLKEDPNQPRTIRRTRETRNRIDSDSE